MPRLRGSHFSPPSSLTYTPPVLIATVTRSDAGSGSTVCTAPPPPPGCQVGRCGWSCSPRTRSNERPPSVLRHSECGSQPAQTTPGRSAEAGRSCHTPANAAPVSSGNRIAPWSVSCPVVPRSSDHMTVGPQWPYWMPASTRGTAGRVSMETAATSCASRCGPSTIQVRRPSSLRASHSPLRVPMASRSVMTSLRGRRIDVRVTVGPAADRIETSRHGPHRDLDRAGRQNSAAGGAALWVALARVGGGAGGALGVPVGGDVRGELLRLGAQLVGRRLLLAGAGGPLPCLLLGQRRALLHLRAFPARSGGLLLGEGLLLLGAGAAEVRLLQVLAGLLPLADLRDAGPLGHHQRRHDQQDDDDNDDEHDDPGIHGSPSSDPVCANSPSARGCPMGPDGKRSLQRATGLPLIPRDGPVVDVAVGGRERRADRVLDLDHVAGLGEAEEPGRAIRGEVDPAVGDVAAALLPDRPGRRVHELAVVGDADGVLDVSAVAAASVNGEAEGG